MIAQARPSPRERSDAEIRAGLAARRLYDLGFNPLPSSPSRKAPALRKGWSRYRTERVPEKWFDRWWAPNIQVVTGAVWRLVVVDVDGWLGLDAWLALAAFKPLPRTWTSVSGGNDADHFGMHLWFSTPPGLTELPSRRLWGIWDQTLNKGQGGYPGKPGIELLGDRMQIVAPPSVHRRTGNEYQWSIGPDDLDRPAEIPAWLLANNGVKTPRKEHDFTPARRTRRKAPGSLYGASLDKAEVLDAIPDKIALAQSWGVRVPFREANDAGWVRCHAIGRPDHHPSAMISIATGRYWEPEMGNRPWSIFELGVALGVARTWNEVVNQVGSELGVSPLRQSCASRSLTNSEYAERI